MPTQVSWSRGTLWSSWVSRSIICIVILAIAIRNYVVLQDYINSSSPYYRSGSRYYVRGVNVGGFAIIAAFCCFTIAFDILEAILYFCKRLSPVFYLVSNLIKFLIWTVYFAVSLIAIVVTGQFVGGFVPAILLLN
ncbi:hypothetical protein B9Z65_7160 [Elsinoe australis]|uniref:Uncharacterized protein n=1 Tax=Elsinoe australis TaxID=40998 RepID=A0A2P7Z604_9PEZI|nr:hypothetical protein B9Z65_7160 [Elsinoe australis]